MMHLSKMPSKSRKPAPGVFTAKEKTCIGATLGIFALGMVLAVILHDSPNWRTSINAAFADSSYSSTYTLPPIVVQLPKSVRPSGSLVISSSLEFNAGTLTEASKGARLAKLLSPRLVDSIVTGVREQRYRIAKDASAADRVILERSNTILRAYGVVASRLSAQHMDYR